MSERERRRRNVRAAHRAKYETALRRRFLWFSARSDYWLLQGDFERAELLDRWAMDVLAEWRRVNPLAELIEG